MLRVGFYAFFDPVSYSADERAGAAGFDTHLGYEADLLTALEAMEGAGLVFRRSGIAEWDGIWLRSAGSRYDLVAGGITILDARTKDATGARVVVFTAGHITFRQSLLVRAEDSVRLARYADLTRDVRVGVLAGTTGEFRLLELTGLVDAKGVVAEGTRIEGGKEVFVADGSATYVVRAGGASVPLKGRRRLYPPSDAQPHVVYLGGEVGERELLDALRTGHMPYAHLVAIDLNAGEIAWKVPFGEGSRELREHPLLQGVALPERLGTRGNSGPLVTKGGLVFVGGGAPYLYAFDTATGAEVWRGATPFKTYANPMTYRARSGRQFIVIATGREADAALVAFARPR